jgi:hypothetical protein
MEQNNNLKELLEKLKSGKLPAQKQETNNDACKRFIERVRARMEELKKQSKEE